MLKLSLSQYEPKIKSRREKERERRVNHPESHVALKRRNGRRLDSLVGNFLLCLSILGFLALLNTVCSSYLGCECTNCLKAAHLPPASSNAWPSELYSVLQRKETSIGRCRSFSFWEKSLNQTSLQQSGIPS